VIYPPPNAYLWAQIKTDKKSSGNPLQISGFLFIDWKVGLKMIQKETPDDVCLGRVLFVSFSVYHN
jgi:hypothetical protein